MQVRYVVAEYDTLLAAEAARGELAAVGVASDLLPPPSGLGGRLWRALQGRADTVRLGVLPEDVERARARLGLAGCRGR